MARTTNDREIIFIWGGGGLNIGLIDHQWLWNYYLTFCRLCNSNMWLPRMSPAKRLNCHKQLSVSSHDWEPRGRGYWYSDHCNRKLQWLHDWKVCTHRYHWPLVIVEFFLRLGGGFKVSLTTKNSDIIFLTVEKWKVNFSKLKFLFFFTFIE